MKRVLIGGFVMMALILGLVGGVLWTSAQGNTTSGVPVTVQGWIQSVEGDVLTLEGYEATTTVLLTDTTLVGNKLGEEGRALLKVGDPVWIRGHISTDGTITATLIRPVNQRNFPRYHVAGLVTAAGTNDMLVETPTWEIKVAVTDTTRIVVPGNAHATLADIQVGNVVTALGKWDEHVFQARAIIVTPPAHRPVAVSGFLVDKSTDSITLETEQDEVQVLVTDKTKIRLKGNQNATLDDLEIGMRLTALGTWTDAHALQAQVITDLRPMNQLHRPQGRRQLKDRAQQFWQRRGNFQREGIKPPPTP